MSKHEKERKLHDAIRAVERKLNDLEISRVVDQSQALRRIKANQFLRARFKLGGDVEFCEQMVESKVIRRPNPTEEAEIRELIDSGLATVDGLEAARTAELKQQLLKQHLNYEMEFIIAERSIWKRPVFAPESITHYHTDKAKRWDAAVGFTFGPEEETTVGDIKGGREGSIRRFRHLFDSK
jgi:hypothetical protein